MPTALQIQNLYKGYWTTLRNEPDWILQNINMDIEQSDICGIMGSNGSGKSTLLKILSRITSPTKGQIIGRGKVISLLETGTFFHPELSGAENIYFNAAMHGRPKKEIKSKFDDIVDFADLASAINHPLKTHSSGMQLRLAFSIAAHLDPDILILDEVLAVADTDFQERCIAKLKSLNQEQGLTILLVSHLSHHLTAICNRGFVLHQGEATNLLDINDAIQAYESGQKTI